MSDPSEPEWDEFERECELINLRARNAELESHLRRLLTDDNLIRMMADYAKGHLSYANSLDEKLGPMRELIGLT